MPSLPQILQAIRANPRVPAPSAAVSRVLALTKDPDADIRGVAQTIARDPGLTGQLLRQANSALYGCTPTSSVNTACARLGLKRVRAAIINEHVVSGLGKACPPGYNANHYWQSALATSVAAFDLATQLMPAAAEDASTAGLLCDIGIGMMTFAIPQAYGQVWKELNGAGLHAIDAIERRIIGVTHAQVAPEILREWKIDQRLIDAVAAHHGDSAAKSESAEQAKFNGIIRVTSMLSGIALDGSDMELVDKLYSAASQLAPNVDKLIDKLLGGLMTHIKQTADSLNVNLGSIDEMEENFQILWTPKSVTS